MSIVAAVVFSMLLLTVTGKIDVRGEVIPPTYEWINRFALLKMCQRFYPVLAILGRVEALVIQPSHCYTSSANNYICRGYVTVTHENPK